MGDSTPGQQPLDAQQTEEANVEPVIELEADNSSSGNDPTSKFQGEKLSLP